MKGEATDGGTRLKRAASGTFFVLLAAATLLVLRILAPFVWIILLALVTAGLIGPWYRKLVAALRGHRRTAALIVCFVLMAAVLVPMFVTVQAVSQEAVGFYEMTTLQLSQHSLLDLLKERRESIDRLDRLLAPFGFRVTPEEVYRQLATLGVKLGGFFYRQGVSLAKGLVRLGFGFLFWLLVLFYTLVDGDALRDWFYDVLPLPAEHQRLVSRRFTDMAGSLVIGNGLAGIIQGVAGGLVFAATGIPGPVLWGVVMGVLAFIPIVGTSLVYLPTAAVLLLAGDTSRALVVLVPLAVVGTIVEYWLKPALVGRRMRMHTLLVFLALLGGLDAFGPVGLIVGPLIMTAFITLIELYCEGYNPKCGALPVPAAKPPDQIPPR